MNDVSFYFSVLYIAVGDRELRKNNMAVGVVSFVVATHHRYSEAMHNVDYTINKFNFENDSLLILFN